MAVNSRGGSSSKTFLGVYSNSLVLEYDKREDLEKKVESMGLDPDLIKVRQRTKGKNEGKDVFYYNLHDVSGMMTNVSLRDTDWGEVLEIEITDVDEKYLLQLGEVFGRIPKDFIRRLGGIDIEKEMAFGTWGMVSKDNGKPYSGVTIYQDDEKVEYTLGREHLPEATKKTRGKKIEWDFSEQEDFLYDVLTKFMDDNFAKSSDESNSTPDPAPKVRTPRASKKQEEEAHDDLPF